MSAAAPWLLDVLDRVLPDLTGGERDRIAAEIVDAFPRKDVARAIAASARSTLLATRLVDKNALANEIGNGAAVAMDELLIGVDPAFDEPTAIPDLPTLATGGLR